MVARTTGRRAALALVLVAGLLGGCGSEDADGPVARPDVTPSPATPSPAAPGSAAPTATSPASRAPAATGTKASDLTCEPAGDEPAGAFYPGPAVSAAYEAAFVRGPAIPHLRTHTPQGLTVWEDWEGAGQDLLLLGAYREGEPSYLIGIDPDTGEHVGTVQVPESHLGSLGVVGDWLVAQHRNGAAVRTYRIDDVRDALQEATGSEAADRDAPPAVPPTGPVQRLPAANFMGTFDGRAWIGDYAGEPDSSLMREYTVSATGRLSPVGEPWQVPPRTQGVLVTEDRFVFVSGLRAGTITVVERGGRRLADSVGRCFVSPSHGQNVVVHDDKVFLAFEGGSAKYAGEDTTPNKITHLHVADYAELTGLG